MKYLEYKSLLAKVKDLEYASALLQWDMETYMPSKSIRFRSQQIATLQTLAHELFTDKKTGILLNDLLKEDLAPDERKNIELSLEDYDKATKFSADFVNKSSVLRTEAFQAWLKAREVNDYNIFEPYLKKMVELKREEAALTGYEEHPYDALLDSYEKGATVKFLNPLFNDIKVKLVDLTKEIKTNGKKTYNDFLKFHYPKDQQWDLGLTLLKEMGYDFEAGRQDISAHPFTTNFSPEDVRVTTRIDENDLMSMIGSCIHEGGHALYEQGLSTEQYGLPLGSAASLGIHESQSRLWEINVGMSFSYWKANFDQLQSIFPAQLSGLTVTDFYKAINQIEPNLIRVEADELHYHLHVLIRYELEKALLEGSLNTENLNLEWNKKYKDYLGVDVPDDKNGILQDIHWSYGLFGYFPTYSLGSFYAAQFYQQALKEIPNLLIEIERGEMSSLLIWLREKIHQHGRKFTSEELCQNICSEGLNIDYFLQYVERKYKEIYEY
jgi:carboxypeptidase Taq